MTVLYVDRREMRIEREGKAIVLRDGEKRLTSIPMRMLERLVIQGNARIDAYLFHHLAREGVPVAILGHRRGAIALVQGSLGANARRRLAQYQRYQDAAWRVRWSRRLLGHKLRTHRRLLLRLSRTRKDLRHSLTKGIHRLETVERQLAEAGTLATLRGLEGVAARSYFEAYTQAFAPSLGFTGRNRRPPKDPVNAVLSLGYTLLHAELVIACHQQGLDPLIGFYHELDHGRESLASDLMEPLRFRVDQWTWTLFRERTLAAHHFYGKGEGCFLNKPARALFYQGWERQARPLRRLTRRIVIQVAHAIEAEAE